MRPAWLAAALAAALAAPAGADDITSNDPVLASIAAEALERSPEYARARATVQADRERVPQVGALPDPTLTLGIQNDGFTSIQIGKMETSFWQIMATQPFPWPGKRGARESAALAQARVTEAQLDRIRLSTTAEVERAYVDLLLVRGQLELQSKLEALWKEAEAVARARYEVGQAPQSDLLRAQLERTRLEQQRVALEATERTRIETLNRLRVHPLGEAIPTTRRLADLGDPPLLAADAMVEDAEQRSPDLAQARLATEAAKRKVDVANHDRWPDLSFTAGVMPRGSLDPMWLASIGITLPIFSGSKQSRAVAESVSRRESEEHGEETIRQIVQLRAQERHTLLASLVRTDQLYRGGLLVQSDAAVHSALGQYQVGRVTFAAVLEVLRGLVSDESGYLGSVAQAQRVAIAQREVSLESLAGGGGGLATGSVPGAGGMSGAGGGRNVAPSGGGQEAAAPTVFGGAPSGM